MRKIKRHGGIGRWPAYEFALDQHGRWLFSPKGTVYHGYPVGEAVIEIEVGQGNRSEGLDVMHLVPHSEWWIASWYELNGVRHVAADICTPAELIGDEWSYEDLELDPYWASDGRIGVEDEEEFEAACRGGSITIGEAAAARSATSDLVGWLERGTEPFGSFGWGRFDDAGRRCLPPIRTLRPAATAQLGAAPDRPRRIVLPDR